MATQNELTTTACGNLITLDPVQGLVDYVLDIKPYHTKIVEVLIEYVYQENVDVIVIDETLINVDLIYPEPPFTPVELSCHDGFGAIPYGGFGVYPIISPNPTISFYDYPAIDVSTNSFTIPGDRTGDFKPGTIINIVSYVEDFNNLYQIVDINPGSAGTGSFVVSDPITGSPSSRVGDVFESF